MNPVKNDNKKVGAKASVNPFVKAIKDKKKIMSAIREGKDLSKLKDIKFVRPL